MLRILGDGITVTGHSLGGALAQMAAALYSGLVARCVTFEAPGIPAHLIAQMRESRQGQEVVSRHHVVDADAIPNAGEAHTQGDVIVHDTPDPTGPGGLRVAAERAFEAHTIFPLAEEAGEDLPPGASIPRGASRPDGPMGQPQQHRSVEHSQPLLEAGRIALGSVVPQDQYARFWFQLRRLADLGTTRYSALLRRIERYFDLSPVGQFGGLRAGGASGDRERLRENLDGTFPELRVASTFEGAIRRQTIPRPEALVAAVRHAGISIDADRERRLTTYFQHVRLHLGMPWVPDALGASAGVHGSGAH
jgi:pimeloyl-ACP methyl ester carboxylesterase